MAMYDPLEVSARVEKIVARGEERKYYRFRPALFYGGIATADCVGCNLSCAFCWSGAPRRSPERSGRFCSPEQVFEKLDAIATKRGFSQLRVSGNEPTIGRQHLLKLLELVDRTRYKFILETNGILIGADASYARALAMFKRLHVRVSLKGCDAEQFSLLTGAGPEAFELQLASLRNLIDAGASCHAAVMQEFAEGKIATLKKRLEEIDRRLADELEFEYLIPYPHVVRELAKRGLQVRGGELRESIRKNY
jgi:uncharacterized Fe-S cluster-containing radical SAM superfamily protein